MGGSVKPLDLQTIEHSTLTWNCECHLRDDVTQKQAFLECTHTPIKKFSHIELVFGDHEGIGALFEEEL